MKHFTIGQLAKHTNVTIRTLRYYDKINLLIPSDYKEGGHRLYSVEDLQRLQQIQSLKFIGLSLKEIDEFLQKKSVEQEHLEKSIRFKKKELLAKRAEIEKMIEQLDHMETMIEDRECVDISIFCFIIHSIIWEEAHLDDFAYLKESVYDSITAQKRKEIDKNFFHLYTEVKVHVANEVSPSSLQAQQLIKEIMENVKQLSLFDKEKSSLAKVKDTNIYNPFTKEEASFLQEALIYFTQE
ncbi:hypothetical protein BAMA_20590 [Bacillus manliponensis]|uniref:HTH merR-type domain-containing protein n=1 Tax=Bacillus manliponensis TaxID=574376 RepID=A0A073JZD9_9BACI|nr:MerR family transcriptional regulator [Bacillus manliponensis]KEK19661.1 hypothetical protein BAMA_20590 [Bacillus manliponensis]